VKVADDLEATLSSISQALEAVGVRWAIGGSLASGVHGEPRLTNDVDIVACLRVEHVAAFRRALGEVFYSDEGVVRRAVAAHDSFNLIDERTILKVDVFVPAPGAMGEGQLDRRVAQPLSEFGPQVFVLGAEDTILQKLRWYELGGRVSERQWTDIVSVIRIKGSFDRDYMRQVAGGADLGDLLERALREGSEE
jgi:hypothetical protein